MQSVSLQDSIIMMDSEGDVIYWNRASEKMFGWSEEEAAGSKLHSLIVPDILVVNCEKAVLHFAGTGDGKAVNKTLEMTAKHKDGHEFPVELTLGAVKINDRWFAIGVVRDMAKKKKLEFQLIHAEKMESVATMAGGLAHDFNNILSSIVGFTELAMDDVTRGSVLYDNLKEVIIASNRAKDLVRRILKFSSQHVGGKPAPVHVKSVVYESLKMIIPSLPQGIEINTILKSEAFIMAESSQIHQIVLNLCSNAVDSMADGGVLSVSLSDMSSESVKTIFKQGMSDFPYICLSISDTGSGMTTDILGKAFTPFFTTKKQGDGTGMGLPVVHGIVTSLNGRVYPYSEPGLGSTFHIFIPSAKLLPENAVVKKKNPGEGERILFVDDEPSIVKVGKRLLEKSGYKVDAVENSNEALELFRVSPGRYRLLITDYAMPSKNGIELANEIMSIRPELPVVLCTGLKSKNITEEAAANGIKAVVGKPIQSDEITEAIGRVLDTE